MDPSLDTTNNDSLGLLYLRGVYETLLQSASNVRKYKFREFQDLIFCQTGTLQIQRIAAYLQERHHSDISQIEIP